MTLNKKQLAMLEKAITWMISDLQYERHQALKHGCKGGSYDNEIKEYRELKAIISNANI